VWQVEALERLAPSDGTGTDDKAADAAEEGGVLEPYDSVLEFSEEGGKELREAFLTQPIYRSNPQTLNPKLQTRLHTRLDLTAKGVSHNYLDPFLTQPIYRSTPSPPFSHSPFTGRFVSRDWTRGRDALSVCQA